MPHINYSLVWETQLLNKDAGSVFKLKTYETKSAALSDAYECLVKPLAAATSVEQRQLQKK